jgi:single-strand DNA-binding protein
MINVVTISGNLGRDPELRSTQGGTQVLTFSLAVSDRKRNPQSGEWEDVTNWVPCVVFGKRAESLSRLLSKGMKCAVEGKLRQSSYKDKSGQNRSKIEVVVDEIEFLSGSKAQNGQNQQQANNYTNQYQNAPNMAPQQPQGGYQQAPNQQPDLYGSEVPF